MINDGEKGEVMGISWGEEKNDWKGSLGFDQGEWKFSKLKKKLQLWEVPL